MNSNIGFYFKSPIQLLEGKGREIDVGNWSESNSKCTGDKGILIPFAHAEKYHFLEPCIWNMQNIKYGLALQRVSNKICFPFAKELQRAPGMSFRSTFFGQNRYSWISRLDWAIHRSLRTKSFPGLAQIPFCEGIPKLRQTIMRLPLYYKSQQ